jgi:hypothetical protein
MRPFGGGSRPLVLRSFAKLQNPDRRQVRFNCYDPIDRQIL